MGGVRPFERRSFLRAVPFYARNQAGIATAPQTVAGYS